MSRYKAECGNCKVGGVLEDTFRDYVMSEGATLAIEQTFAYCSQCDTVVWSEVIPSLEELEERLLEVGWEAEYPELWRGWKPEDIEEQIRRQKQNREMRILWRKARQSSARCLFCGSCDISPAVCTETINEELEWEIPCPKCPGKIQILDESVLILDRSPSVPFSPEGLPLSNG